jgi:hypothetical protein
MIIRILGEGRYEVADSDMGPIDQLDTQLVDALEGEDESTFTKVLEDLIEKVRSSGKLLAPDDPRTSSLAVPHEGSTLEEVEDLLAEET